MGNKKVGRLEDYNEILNDIKYLLDRAKSQAYKAVDNIRVQTYWQIGERIAREELKFKSRAEYGKNIIKRLAKDINFSPALIWRLLQFYKTYPILVTVSRELSWSHYEVLITTVDDRVRQFYEQQSIQNRWSVRKLRDEIKNNLYKRARNFCLRKNNSKLLHTLLTIKKYYLHLTVSITSIAVPRINNNYSFKNISTNSEVECTLTSSCFLKSFSLDQIPQPRCKANAKYGTSLLCGANFSALDCISEVNLYIGNISILSLRISNTSITSDLEVPQILAIASTLLLNSFIKYGKATNLNLSSKNKSFVLPLPIIAANKTVASTTSSIYLASRNLFATASEILSVNSLATLSDTLILDENLLSFFNFSALSKIALLATSSQSSLNSCMLFSNSSGTDIVIVPILSSPIENNENQYLKLLIKFKKPKNGNCVNYIINPNAPLQRAKKKRK